MKKSIEFSLVPDENKLYNAKMFKDNSLFKEEKVDAETMKYYMLQKMSEKELINLRTAVKLFKTKKIKLVGFCLLIRKKILDKIGVLDEIFSPGNYEDDDLSIRILLDELRKQNHRTV